MTRMSTTEPAPTTAAPIVLIHGLWMTPLSWEKWSDRFTQRGHQVLAPGLARPGGRRRRAAPQPGAGREAERGRDPRPTPIVMGHSFGGGLYAGAARPRSRRRRRGRRLRSNLKLYRKSPTTVDYKEFPGRSHYTLGQDGWEQVADYALDWATQQAAAPAPARTETLVRSLAFELTMIVAFCDYWTCFLLDRRLARGCRSDGARSSMNSTLACVTGRRSSCSSRVASGRAARLKPSSTGCTPTTCQRPP